MSKELALNNNSGSGEPGDAGPPLAERLLHLQRQQQQSLDELQRLQQYSRQLRLRLQLPREA